MKNRLFHFTVFGLLFLMACASFAQTGSDTALIPKSITRSMSAVDESTGNRNLNYARLSRDKEMEVSKLVTLYQQAAQSDKNRVRQQIIVALYELFELNVKKREAEIKSLEAELEDVQRGLEFRKMNRDKIIEKRLVELLGG